MAADNHVHEDESSDAVTPFGAPSSFVPSILLDLPLHHMLRSLQLQHGLRHGDYQRYRHYLNRRLARLRKGVNATHRGGKAFESKNVHSLAFLGGDPSALKKEHLLLVLLNAERAWAFAMHLQQDAAGNQHMPSYVRSHFLRRLRRAGVWAARLLGLVEDASDQVTERTSLEVQAYAGWMGAAVDVEQEEWGHALVKLRTAHSILSQLGELGSLEEQDLFLSKADEVLQSARYCQYNLGEGSFEDLNLDVDTIGATKNIPEALVEKLNAVKEASRAAAATGLETVEWGGRQLHVSSKEVRLALIKLEEARTALDSSLESMGGAKRVGEEVSKLQKMNSGSRVEAQKEDLRLLMSYLKHGKLETMRVRSEELIQAILCGGDRSGKRGRPEDLVHILEGLVQTTAEMEGLPGIEDLESVLMRAQTLQALYRAQRLFYLGEIHATNARGKGHLAAMALFERAKELGREVEVLAQEMREEGGSSEKEELLERAGRVVNMARGGWYRARTSKLMAYLPLSTDGAALEDKEAAFVASILVLSVSAQENQATGWPSTLERNKGKKGAQEYHRVKGKKGENRTQINDDVRESQSEQASRMLLDRLGDLDVGKESSEFGIAHVPPVMAPVRAKPQVFDIAFNFLEERLPSLAASAGVSQTSTRGAGNGSKRGLFGWLRG
ncbi:hypothetical protein NSK_005568 [Nannochloropsis salina CCMP1776]|uniref:Signal recognition particle subunit SRP68 n=1 Tax=Nannochloropsis salina CCMP1776 TaxID=1027361 RepID=A0A4D9D3F1_9STRA|nr:hypothetical protein NSK_005568 [Nannochloropsis salina CCMP1776]|eukprot:TFJ83148.1 hypothetical protein NSK_005568 [Nannochloropsis salina CCMP1776]